MEEIKDTNEGAYKWLIEHTNKKNWSRAFFGFHAKCDILVNNISECLNRVLLFAREKPLLGMLECIRMYMMDRFTIRRKFAARIEDCFGPKIRKKIEKLKEKTGECMAREAGDWIYQVNTKWNEQFVVNLRDRTCSCRRWMLTGIPCHHAITAIEMACETVDQFVDTCYSKESFQKVYQPIIYPLEGPNLWPKTMEPDVIPPEIIKLPGRPKGARQKTSEERKEINNKKAKTKKVKICELSHGMQKMSRSGMMPDYKCRNCGEKGHNKRKCPQLHPLESERVVEAINPKDAQECGKKHRRNHPQHCSLCYQPGHKRSRCTSTVAAMYNNPTFSSVAVASSSGQATSSSVPAAPSSVRAASSTVAVASSRGQAISSSVPTAPSSILAASSTVAVASSRGQAALRASSSVPTASSSVPENLRI